MPGKSFPNPSATCAVPARRFRLRAMGPSVFFRVVDAPFCGLAADDLPLRGAAFFATSGFASNIALTRWPHALQLTKMLARAMKAQRKRIDKSPSSLGSGFAAILQIGQAAMPLKSCTSGLAALGSGYAAQCSGHAASESAALPLKKSAAMPLKAALPL